MATTQPLKFRGSDLLIRPVRPADRERVIELCRDIWDGHDYVPRVFDDWVSDSASAFQAVEVDGVVVGLQRLRPYASGLLWYEGLRVASSHRRQGLARHMLLAAVAQAREQDFREIRLATGNPAAAKLFDEVGFVRLQDNRWWKGFRVEGGESPRIPGPNEAERLWAGIATSPGIELWGGVTADFQGAQDIGPKELARLADIGMLRSGPGGRAIVALREPWGNNISVAFLAGKGGALRDLLLALRFEADADGLDDVTVAIPRDHPSEEDLRASGYDFANDDDTSYIYGLKL
ncbi:MAG TPA: GNAT family N-acetyltransferase [Candidatus Micrarchaeaceae archaeon]|nr:GNAT family N-acetyltransferase [Candidatus Micrarchaeaceae archaeon]